MLQLHLVLAWAWFAAGGISGAIVGIRFWREQWMGGYQSWRRRLVRLGHIAFFGTGLLNIAFVGTLPHLQPAMEVTTGSVLLILGTLTMPVVCFMAAWRQSLRHLFVVPVLGLIGAALCTLWVLASRGAGGS